MRVPGSDWMLSVCAFTHPQLSLNNALGTELWTNCSLDWGFREGLWKKAQQGREVKWQVCGCDLSE